MIRLKRWWSYRSSHATTKMQKQKKNHRIRHVTTALTTRATPQATQHSTQRDIAVRERAYFLWGSSPCLVWRVYTHNASRARRGGSPRQSAPPPGSPGSTGPGPLWYRTGKRRSPCYLQMEIGGQTQRWVKYCISCYPPGTSARTVHRALIVLTSFKPFSFIPSAIKQGQREKIKPRSQQTDGKKKSVWFNTCITSCVPLKSSPNHFASIKCVHVLWFEHNLSCFAQQGYVLLHPRCPQSIFIQVHRELFTHWERVHWDRTLPLHWPLGTSAHLSAFHYSSVPADE